MSIRSILVDWSFEWMHEIYVYFVFQRKVVIPAMVMGGSITYAAVYGPWIGLKFNAVSTLSQAFQLLDPETAHEWAIWAAEKRLLPKDQRKEELILRTHLWGRIYPNPIGKI